MFTKWWIVRAEGSVNLVGRNLEKPELPFLIVLQGFKIPLRFFQQLERALNIGPYECGRPRMDRST